MFDFFWFNSFRYNLGRFFDDYLIFCDIIGCFGAQPVRNKHDDEYYDEIEKKTATKPGKDTLQCAYEYRFLSFHFATLCMNHTAVSMITLCGHTISTFDKGAESKTNIFSI